MISVLLFLATVSIWGLTWYAITFQLGLVPIEWSVAYRFAIAAVVMFAICRATGRTLRFPRTDHILFAGLGMVLFSLNYFFTYQGTRFLPSGLVAVTFSTMSLMNLLNSRILLKRPSQMRVIAGALAGVFGVGLIFLPEMDQFSLSDMVIKGILLTLAATYLSSLGNIIAGSPRGIALPTLSKIAWAMAYGAAAMVILAAFTGQPPAFETSPDYIFSLLFLAVLGSALSFTLFFTLIRREGVEKAGYISVVIPVVALFVSTLFEGYEWTLTAGTGLALVVAGNVMILKRKQ